MNPTMLSSLTPGWGTSAPPRAGPTSVARQVQRDGRALAAVLVHGGVREGQRPGAVERRTGGAGRDGGVGDDVGHRVVTDVTTGMRGVGGDARQVDGADVQ